MNQHIFSDDPLGCVWIEGLRGERRGGLIFLFILQTL